MTVIDDRVAHMNNAIAAAAAVLADQLKAGPYAEVRMEPGDGTSYPIIVCRKDRSVWSNSGRHNEHGYLVVLAADFGRSYPWGGQPVEPDYAALNWAVKGHVWTGTVMASLLSTLSADLETE